jgi:hypothetical protein
MVIITLKKQLRRKQRVAKVWQHPCDAWRDISSRQASCDSAQSVSASALYN